MNAPSTTGTIPTTAPIALWRAAPAFIHILHALFGAPTDVAAGHPMTLKAHKMLASWLRCGEAMMRRLLVIEAAAYAKPNTRVSRPRASKPMSFTPEEPGKWRVSFRCFVPRTLRQAQGDAVCGAGGPDSVSLRLSKAERPVRPFIFRECEFILGAVPTPTLKRLRRTIKRTRRPPILRQERE